MVVLMKALFQKTEGLCQKWIVEREPLKPPSKIVHMNMAVSEDDIISAYGFRAICTFSAQWPVVPDKFSRSGGIITLQITSALDRNNLVAEPMGGLNRPYQPLPSHRISKSGPVSPRLP